MTELNTKQLAQQNAAVEDRYNGVGLGSAAAGSGVAPQHRASDGSPNVHSSTASLLHTCWSDDDYLRS